MELTETDAALGLNALIEGRVDAAIVLRRATPAEARHAEGGDIMAQAGLWYELVARLPVTFLIHESNRVDVMTEEELVRVMAGEVREWDSMGGRSEEIALYGRPPGTSTSAQIELLLAGRPLATAMKALPSDAAVAIAVRADPLGLGVGGGAPGRGTRPLAVRRGDEVLMPGLRTSSKEPWPWVRDVYIVTQGPPTRRVREVRDYARSDEGRRIAEQSGFFSWDEGWQ
jgi:phosphate transport system substrate-binding protein